METCRSTNKNWVDTSFCEVIDSKINGMKMKGWKRIRDIVPKAELMSTVITPALVLQGQCNDCYWHSAVASLARFEYRIEKLFLRLETN